MQVEPLERVPSLLLQRITTNRRAPRVPNFADLRCDLHDVIICRQPDGRFLAEWG